MSKHWETHLYTYAVALIVGAAIKPDNLRGMKRKALRHGHTPGEVSAMEADPLTYVQTGRLA